MRFAEITRLTTQVGNEDRKIEISQAKIIADRCKKLNVP